MDPFIVGVLTITAILGGLGWLSLRALEVSAREEAEEITVRLPSELAAELEARYPEQQPRDLAVIALWALVADRSRN